jgi:hypothetical protein
MTESSQQSEDRVMSLLRRGLDESDPVPVDVVDFAKAALAWRSIDAELAELSYDSSHEQTPAGVRSTSTARMLSFETGDWLADLEYSPATGRLMGQVEPARIMTVELHLGGGVVATEADELGRFVFDGVLPGPIALVFRLSDDETVKTQWVVI